jgi:hypothetical protein
LGSSHCFFAARSPKADVGPAIRPRLPARTTAAIGSEFSYVASAVSYLAQCASDSEFKFDSDVASLASAIKMLAGSPLRVPNCHPAFKSQHDLMCVLGLH